MKIEVRKPSAEEMKQAETWPTWKKEVSEFPWSYDQTETCLILEGKAEVTTTEGETVSFGKGDWVIFPTGLSCTWKIIEPIKKRYNFS